MRTCWCFGPTFRKFALKLTGLTLIALVSLSSLHATAAGPQTAPAAGRASTWGWWSSLKARVAQKIDQIRGTTPKPQIPQTAKPAAFPSPNVTAASSRPLLIPLAPPPRRSAASVQIPSAPQIVSAPNTPPRPLSANIEAEIKALAQPVAPITPKVTPPVSSPAPVMTVSKPATATSTTAATSTSVSTSTGGWWNALKARVARKTPPTTPRPTESPSAQQTRQTATPTPLVAAPATPKPQPPTPTAVPTTTIPAAPLVLAPPTAPPTAPPAAPPAISAPSAPAWTAAALLKLTRIKAQKLGPAQFERVRTFSPPQTPVARVNVVPTFTIKPKKSFALVLAPIAPAAPTSKRIPVVKTAGPQRRARLVLAKHILAPFQLPRGATKRVLPLKNAIAVEAKPIQPLFSEELQLVRALLTWLNRLDDQAIAKLYGIDRQAAQKSGTEALPEPKARILREKSSAFIGWVLELANRKALSAFALSRALSFHGAQSYDTEILLTLGRFSKSTMLGKQFLGDAALRELNLRNPDAFGFKLLVEAERAADRGDFEKARAIAQTIPQKSSWKEQGRYLAATTLFAKDHSDAKQHQAGRELTDLFRTVEDSTLFDAVALSLGEIHFILGNYAAAKQYLSQVSHDSNLFIDASIDQAWALLRSGNRNDAVGNMFALHTPFFDGAYMPDSYFIQALGYQEICQFGDAMTAVRQYREKYLSEFKSLSHFNAAKHATGDYYQDLAGFLSKRPHELQPLTSRELGRNPQFLRRQKALNLIAADEREVAKVFPKSGPQLLTWAKNDFTASRESLKSDIGRFLKTRSLEIEEELKFLTANMALLEYEILAGAGANLALQGARNFAVEANGKPAAAGARKPAFDGAKQFWPYEDEVWEDELNNFKSKMIDACANHT